MYLFYFVWLTTTSLGLLIVNNSCMFSHHVLRDDSAVSDIRGGERERERERERESERAGIGARPARWRTSSGSLSSPDLEMIPSLWIIHEIRVLITPINMQYSLRWLNCHLIVMNMWNIWTPYHTTRFTFRGNYFVNNSKGMKRRLLFCCCCCCCFCCFVFKNSENRPIWAPYCSYYIYNLANRPIGPILIN